MLLSDMPGFSAAEAQWFTPQELAALERENQMWRMMSPEDDVPTNLRRLRAAGYGVEEIALFLPKLEQVWSVQAERNVGWLNQEAVEKINTVDREFIPRMRVARLFAAVGIQLGGRAAPVVEVNSQWRRAILEVLNHDELAEFRLVNSSAAREIGRLLEGVTLSTGEERRLFQLERDYRAAYQSEPITVLRGRDVYQREARLDHLTAVRETLGDERFVVYLGRADREFEEMRLTLARLDAADTALALEMWRIRQKHAINRSRRGMVSASVMSEMDRDAQSAAATALGEERFQRYMQEENARWMVSVRRTYRSSITKAPAKAP